MLDDLTRNILEQRDNIENQRIREINYNNKYSTKKYRYKGYELQQTSYNWHYMIIDLRTKESVLHCSCNKELNEEEMKKAIDVFIEIISTTLQESEYNDGKN